MTLVGPRPEVQQYVNLFRHDYEEILRVRPGLTDLASLKYRDEAPFLAAADPEQVYIKSVLPDKIALAKEYDVNTREAAEQLAEMRLKRGREENAKKR